MRPENQHIIQRQTIEIEFENMDDSLGIQDHVAQVYYENLQPRLEILLDEMFGKDIYASIEKLEIDCGQLSIENWEQEFATQAELKLKEGLVQINSKAVNVKELEESTARESFFFFLENGFLPWNNRIDSLAELESLIKVDEKLIVTLKKLIQQREKVAQRLAYQFSAKFIAKIFAALTSDRKAEIEFLSGLTGKADTLQKALNSQGQVEKQWIDTAILQAFSSEDSNQRELLFFTTLLKKIESNSEMSSEITKIIEKLRIYSGKQHSDFKNNLPEPDLLKSQVKASKKPNETAARENRESETRNEKHIIESTKPADSVYIANAGLVLLHPFIEKLFENLKLTSEKNWVDETSKSKAVLVLEFLATGNDEIEEFELMLNKILCGISIDEVVPTTILPDEEAKTECDVLLMEAIKHWDVLKNTSISGLRGAFLQRKGKLSRVDDGWLLQVEQKSIDVLLNNLPWGIGIIKLPWMNEMIVVDWT